MNKIPGQTALPGLPDAPAPAVAAVGRPVGSTNKRWQRWQAMAGAMRVHPIQFLLQTAAKTERELAIELGLVQRGDDGAVLMRDGEPVLQPMALRDAHVLRREAARDVLPYVEQKTPTAVDHSVGEGQRMVMIVGGMSAAQADAAKARFGFKVRDQQNQGVIEGTATQSDGDQSDAQPNLLDVMENGR